MRKKNIVLFLIFLIAISTFSVLAQDYYEPNEGVVRLVKEGVRLHKNKDFIGALKAFEEALMLDPENTTVRQNISIAHNNYGKYLLDRTDYEKSLREFRLAIYFDPQNKTADANLDTLLSERGVKASDPQVRLQLGDKLRTDASFELALVEYQKALMLSKVPDPTVLINIGDIYYILYLRDGQNTIDIKRALDFYIKALEAKETARAHIKIGDALLAFKDVVKAIDHFKKAIQLEPDSQDALTANIRGWNEAVRLAPLVPENHIGLAIALQAKKDFVNAEEEYNQALKLDPGNEVAQRGLQSIQGDKIKLQANKLVEEALKLQSEKKYTEAIAQYVKALELNPNDSKIHYNVGTAFQAIDDFEHADKAYKKSLELDPSNEKAKAALTLLAQQMNDKKVKELLTRAIELQNSNNYQEAITTYLAAISIDQNNASIFYNLGTAYQANGDLNNAQIQYQKAIDLDKTNEAYINAIKTLKTSFADPLIQSAINKQSANDLVGAIADYVKALEYTPDDAQIHFNLATAYQTNKQINEAIQSYQKAIQIDPKGQSDAVFFLATLYEEQKNNKLAIENYQKYIQISPAGQYLKDAKDRMNYLKTLK